MDKITIKPYEKEKKAVKEDIVVKEQTLKDAVGAHKTSTSTLGCDEKDAKTRQI